MNKKLLFLINPLIDIVVVTLFYKTKNINLLLWALIIDTAVSMIVHKLVLGSLDEHSYKNLGSTEKYWKILFEAREVICLLLAVFCFVEYLTSTKAMY